MEEVIKSTTDYDMFKIHPLNRKISLHHVIQLSQSIAGNNQLSVNPIVVNLDNEIISGQHRYMAAKRLGIPIYYITKDVDKEFIITANKCQRKVNFEEAIEYYIATEHNEDYKILKQCKLELGIPYGCAAALLGETLGKKSVIQDGRFKIRRGEGDIFSCYEKYKEMINFLHDKPFEYKGAYKTHIFCCGFRKFTDDDQIYWPQFMKKLRMSWMSLDCSMPSSYMWCNRLLDLYNRAQRVKITLNDAE